MLIIGERINATNKSVGQAIASRDKEFLTGLARKQADAGADYIDVNAGVGVGSEGTAAIEWLIDLVQEAVDKPLCIDSDDPDMIEAALKRYRGDKVMINSVNAEPEKLERIGRLVVEWNAKVVALIMKEGNIPRAVAERMEAAETIMEHLGRLGVSEDRIYFDPLVLPISVDTSQGMVTLKTIERIKSRFPTAKTVMGLSNISYGLPNRGMVNRSFMLMSAGAGLDAAILDPLDARMMSLVRIGDMLTGNDQGCRKYIRAHRKGLLVE
ncbi:MAG: dihydropteroate synthase [Dehalococcoidia bacterium]|jgi:5-methyltetrahydrofolate--homocysteine methyltransferase